MKPLYAINILRSYDFCNWKRFSLHYIKYRCKQNWTKNWIENLLKWSYLKSKSLTFRYLDALLRAFSQYCEIWLTPLVSLLTCDDVHHDGVRDAGCGAAGVLPAVLQPHPRDPEHQHVVRFWLPDQETETSLQLGAKFVRTSLLSQHSSYIRGKLHYSISRPNCLLVKAKDWKWDTETSYISGISTLCKTHKTHKLYQPDQVSWQGQIVDSR